MLMIKCKFLSLIFCCVGSVLIINSGCSAGFYVSGFHGETLLMVLMNKLWTLTFLCYFNDTIVRNRRVHVVFEEKSLIPSSIKFAIYIDNR